MKEYFKLASILLLIIFFSGCSKEDNPVSTSYNNPLLNDLVSKIKKGDYGEVHSIIISKNDTIIFEEYFNGYTRDDPHAMFSVTKSFTSAVMGICSDKGWIDSMEMKILGFFPEYRGNIQNYDSSKEQITVEHLLTMTSGFEWDEWSTPYGSANNVLAGFIQSSDWVKYILDLPMSYAPGTHITYNSGVSHVISGIITKVSGASARFIAYDNLFAKMGFENWSWENRPNGVSIGGWGLSIRPLDMIKFGQLYLHKGQWNGEQIISEKWIDESIKPQNLINQYCNYGYQWWTYRTNTCAAGRGIYFAAGRGEQFIWVIPVRNAVAVCTAWNDNESLLEPVLCEYILPVLENWK